MGVLATDQVVRPPWVSGVGPRPLIGVVSHWGTLACAPRQPAAYHGACPPRISVVGTQSADLGARQLGLRYVLGLLIPRSQSRG